MLKIYVQLYKSYLRNILHNLQGQSKGLHFLICFLNSFNEGKFFISDGIIFQINGPK